MAEAILTNKHILYKFFIQNNIMKTYELIDHTADIGLKAYGKTLSEAYENAAKGMFDIITDSSEIESVGQYDIRLEAPDLGQLLVDFLSELLFLNFGCEVALNRSFPRVNPNKKSPLHSAHDRI